MTDVGFLASATPLNRFLITYRSRWNEAELPRSEVISSRDLVSARSKAAERAREEEVVIDVVPFS